MSFRLSVLVMVPRCLIALATVAFAARTTPAPSAERNVILFVTDDHGQDAGCYGNPVIQTCNLDALAIRGTVFTHAFCTTASCSASRSVILTGMHNHANGHYGHEHAYHKFSSYPDVKTLPVRLTEAGYRTARIGKYHVAPADTYKFDTVLKGNARNAVQMANASREFITADSDKPFFLYFCTADPHRSGDVVETSSHRPNRFGNRVDGYPGVQTVEFAPEDVIVPPFLPDTPVCREELAQYYQSVSRVDQGLGRLIQILSDAGHLNTTLFIFISDHGIAFPGAKTTLYEPGMRSPCVVVDPYEKQVARSDAMISWVDLTPTILDFAKALPAPPSGGRDNPRTSLHGRSFLPTLKGETGDAWDEVYASHTFHEITMYYPMRVVRERKYKLIWNIAHPLPFPFASDLWEAPTWQAQFRLGPQALYGRRTVGAYMQRPEFELYDLEQDPNEIKNLADAPDHAETVRRLKQKLRDFQKKTNDPWILKWDYE